MAEFLLGRNITKKVGRTILAASLAGIFVAGSAFAAKDKKEALPSISVPEVLMDGGRKLRYERMFSNEHEVKPKRGFFTKIVDVVIGAPDYRSMVRPYHHDGFKGSNHRDGPRGARCSYL